MLLLDLALQNSCGNQTVTLIDHLFPFSRTFSFPSLQTCTWTVVTWLLYFLNALICHWNSQEMKSSYGSQIQLKPRFHWAVQFQQYRWRNDLFPQHFKTWNKNERMLCCRLTLILCRKFNVTGRKRSLHSLSRSVAQWMKWNDGSEMSNLPFFHIDIRLSNEWIFKNFIKCA